MTIKSLEGGIEYLPQIQDIEERSFPDPWTREQLTFYLKTMGHTLLAAYEGEELVGYLCLDYVLDEGGIANFAVSPEHRRQGIGKALLSAAEDRARELKLASLTLEVRQSNLAAIALYEGQGYRLAGLRRKYYVNPNEDALLMTKEL